MGATWEEAGYTRKGGAATDQGTFGVGQSPSLVLSAYLALSKVRQLPTLCRADAVQQSHSFLDATVVANVSMRP